jgi:membrane protease YdiL (CAAX protease family)
VFREPPGTNHQPLATNHQPPDTNHQSPATSHQPPISRPQPPAAVHRAVALLEVLICSDYPTQLALGTTFALFGFRPGVGGRISLTYVTVLSLADTAILLALIAFFLRAHGERPHDVFVGRRPVAREALLGLSLIPVAFGIAVGVLLAVQRFAPSLHTVAHNPLQDLIASPAQATVFAFVVVVAGGVREEIQRAFLLHRFDVWLGGGTVGIIVTSIAFGAGHWQVQGADAALATGLLGAWWGLVYLRRRSAVAPIASHGGFNLLEIVQFLVVAR